jgi:hypothetical protein
MGSGVGVPPVPGASDIELKGVVGAVTKSPASLTKWYSPDEVGGIL